MASFEEQTKIKCALCKNKFEFSSSEKEFFEKMGLSKPKHCKKCR